MRSELIAVSLSSLLSPVMRWHIGDIRSRRQVTSDRRLAPPVSYCGMLGGDNIWPQIILWTEELKLRCVDINLQHRGCFCVWDTSWHHDKTETKINRRLTSNWLMIEIILLSNSIIIEQATFSEKLNSGRLNYILKCLQPGLVLLILISKSLSQFSGTELNIPKSPSWDHSSQTLW